MSFHERLAAGQLHVGVVGLGTIGLPLATFCAARGFQVTGLDLDPVRVRDVNGRHVAFEYEDVLRDIPLERLGAGLDASSLASCDVVLYCVPTPVDEAGFIRLEFLAAAARSTAPHLKDGALVVLESSVEVGTTRWFKARLEEAAGRQLDARVAYCPERYNPGLPKEEHAQIIYGRKVRLAGPLSYHKVPRVVGALDASARDDAVAFYAFVLDATVTPVSSPEVAEAAKLMENIYRDVNIGLANEFARALSALGVDAYEVIQAASTKPFAFMAHWPGMVGGDCIPVDTWYLIRQAERQGTACPLMRAARAANDGVVTDVGTQVRRMLAEAGVADQPKVAILGTAYKANVYDDRMSPAKALAADLAAQGIQVALCDPVVQAHNHRTKGPLVPLDEALRGADLVVLATDHDVFRRLDPTALAVGMRRRLAVDVRNAWDRTRMERAGFRVYTWGRP